MRTLVTGATGFIGRTVTSQLLQHGDIVGVLTRGADTSLEKSIERYELGFDPWSEDQIAVCISKFQPDLILHFAGAPHARSLLEIYEINAFLGVRLMAAAARVCPTCKILLAGSSAEYGIPYGDDGASRETDPVRPISSYGISKLAQTMHGLSNFQRGQQVGIARIFNPVGANMPKGLAFSDFASRLQKNPETLLTGDLDAKRDFMDIDDTARALIELGRNRRFYGKVVNICSGEARPVQHGLDYMLEHLKGKVNVLRDPSVPNSSVTVSRGCTDSLKELGIEPPSSNIKAAVISLLENRD